MGQNRASAEPKKGYETVGKSTTSPWEPAQGQLQDILGEAKSFYDTGVGTQLPDFSPVAGLGQGTQDVISAALDNATSQNPQYQQLYDKSQGPNAAQDYFAGVMGGNTRDNPFLQQLLDTGSERISNQVNALQSAKGRFAGLGAGGHVDALGQAISDFQTPILFQNYNDAYAREGNAASNFGNLWNTSIAQGAGITGQQDQSQRANFELGLAAGGIEDSAAQNQQTADYDRALWELGGDDQAGLAQYLATVGGIGGLGGDVLTQQPRKPGQKALGATLDIAALLGKLSDRRAKTEIKRVGRTDSGLPIYTYRLRGSHTVEMGVMAQDVAAVAPHAVTTLPDGFLTVNYAEVS